MGLPTGLTTRPARADDAGPICRLIAACEEDLDGQVEIDLDDVVADLGRPGLDLVTDTVLVHERDELVGWAQIFRGRRAEADVRPDRRGRGIGTWLLDWTERRAGEVGADRVVGAALALDSGGDDGFVHQLAVHRDYRHRGIARALLHQAFVGFARVGRRSCTLSTNSYTGALSLYERVGMRIRRSYTHYAN